MKILALHGLGASGALLKAQLSPLIKGLGAGYQFVFLDGAIPCGRGPGMLSRLCTDRQVNVDFLQSTGLWRIELLNQRCKRNLQHFGCLHYLN